MQVTYTGISAELKGYDIRLLAIGPDETKKAGYNFGI